MTRTQLLGLTTAAALAAAAIVAPTPLAAAANQGTLAVTATVAANCTVANNSLAFGAYDPVATNATAHLDQTVIVTVTCTKSTATSVWLGAGTGSNYNSGRRMKNATTSDFLRYELYVDSPRSTPWSNASGTGSFTIPTTGGRTTPATVTVYGRVAAGQDVPVGSYSDSVTMTVNF